MSHHKITWLNQPGRVARGYQSAGVSRMSLPDCYRCGKQPCECKDGITLYCADCRDVLPLLEPGSVDLVLTDPPYGYRFASGWESSHRGQAIANDSDTSCRDFVLEWTNGCPWACFGSWRVPPPETTKTALVWDKGPASGMGDLRLPWKCSWELIWIGGCGWVGHRDEGVLRGHRIVTWESRGRRHINEKPRTLLMVIMTKAPSGTVLDPFAGSGTTGRACKDLGRRCIMIEIEEKYCRIAAERLRQEVLL